MTANGKNTLIPGLTEFLHNTMVVITIDGPAGSGKSTVANKLANKLGFIHLNSGALFRAVALLARERGISLQDEAQLAALGLETDFRFAPDPSGHTCFLVNGVDLGSRISSEETGKVASQIAVFPMLREVLAQVQKKVSEENSLVVEGRDAGTVVFPKADFKFYLDARPEVRAERRFAEVTAFSKAAVPPREASETQEALLEAVRQDMVLRDFRDSNRLIAPQIKALDAILVDTSDVNADQVVEKICGIIGKDRILKYGVKS